MRILVAGPVGTPGGLQTHYKELCSFLEGRGYDLWSVDVELLQMKSGESKKKYTVKAFSSGFLRVISWFFVVFWVVFRAKPQVYIAVGNGFGYTLLALFLFRAKRYRTEVVDSWEGFDLNREVAARVFDGTLMQSNSLRWALLQKVTVANELIVLKCFDSLSEEHSYKAQLYSAREKIIRLCYFGRLGSNKGLLELVRAVSKLDFGCEYTIDIWGSGELKQQISNEIEKNGLSDKVILKGKYPDGNEYLVLLATYHALLSPSQYSEGLPLVLLEAASVGLPTLTCDVGAIKDIKEGNRDCVVLDVGQAALDAGFKEFLTMIQSGEFDSNRLKNWYNQKYARHVCEAEWDGFFKRFGGKI